MISYFSPLLSKAFLTSLSFTSLVWLTYFDALYSISSFHPDCVFREVKVPKKIPTPLTRELGIGVPMKQGLACSLEQVTDTNTGLVQVGVVAVAGKQTNFVGFQLNFVTGVIQIDIHAIGYGKCNADTIERF